MSVKRELVKGTLILTAAGMAARLLGLFNRIYLANLISNAELGRYQLIFPVFMFCMAVSSTGMQVALSKMVSSLHASGKRRDTEDGSDGGCLVSGVGTDVQCSPFYLRRTTECQRVERKHMRALFAYIGISPAIFGDSYLCQRLFLRLQGDCGSCCGTASGTGGKSWVYLWIVCVGLRQSSGRCVCGCLGIGCRGNGFLYAVTDMLSGEYL